MHKPHSLVIDIVDNDDAFFSRQLNNSFELTQLISVANDALTEEHGYGQQNVNFQSLCTATGVECSTLEVISRCAGTPPFLVVSIICTLL